MTDHTHVIDNIDFLLAEVKSKLRQRIEGDPFVQCQAVYEQVIKETREEIG